MVKLTVYSSHSGGQADMETEQCKEGGAQIQVAEEVHYSMGLSIQDMRVGHNRGSQLVAGVVEVGMDDLNQAYDREVLTVVALVEVAEKRKGEEHENMQALLTAEGAGRFGFGDEMNSERSQALLFVKNWIFEPDEAAQQRDKCNHQNFFRPEN